MIWIIWMRWASGIAQNTLQADYWENHFTVIGGDALRTTYSSGRRWRDVFRVESCSSVHAPADGLRNGIPCRPQNPRGHHLRPHRLLCQFRLVPCPHSSQSSHSCHRWMTDWLLPILTNQNNKLSSATLLHVPNSQVLRATYLHTRRDDQIRKLWCCFPNDFKIY